MITADNIAIGSAYAGNSIAIGAVKPLDVKTLLGVYGSAVKADGMVSIDAETLRKMAEELILAKSSTNTPVITRGGGVMNPDYTYLSGNTGMVAI